MRKGQIFKMLLGWCCMCSIHIHAQNLVVDGFIGSSNTNWGGGVSEAPYNNSTFESTYLSTGCNSNYVMEADFESQPVQTVTGFKSGAQYRISFRYGWRNTGCNSSVNPTTLKVEFTDATSVLSQTISVANTVTTLTAYSYVFTNNSSTSHTLKFTNPGNSNTCGVIIDDISIVREASPGGVGTTNLSFWVNPATTGLSDNASIYGIISAGSNVLALIPYCSSPPVYKTGLTGSDYLVSNYNPYISFNGSSQYFQYLSSKVSLIDASSGGSGGTFFSIHQGGGSSQTYFGQQSSGNSRIQSQTGNWLLANGSSSGTNNKATFTNSSRVNLIATCGKSNGLTVRDKNGASLSVSNTTVNTDYLTMGVRLSTSGSYSQYFSGNIAEIITFNTMLTNSQMQRVRSYLASKYGVTLSDNSTTAGTDERNYVASNGTTTYWNYSSNSGYHNNVTVVGRDDNTGLNQIKSISTDADANSNTGNAMLIIDNATSFSSDVSYFAVGHDGVSVLMNETVDVPVTIQSRMKRVWKAQKSGTGVSSSVTLRFDMTNYTPLTGSQLRLLVSTSSVFASATIYAGSYAGNTFTVSLPTTGGLYFTLGSVNASMTPLPLELVAFDASLKHDVVNLSWSTATEINNDYFTIERTSDLMNFTIVGYTDGAGTSNSIRKYQFIDAKPLQGWNYYRLKQTDFDGRFTYSDFESVNYEKRNTLEMQITPVPAQSGNTVFILSGIPDKEVKLSVYDSNGRIVFSRFIKTGSSGNIRYAADFISELPPGVYVAKAICDDQMVTKKLIYR